MGWAVIEKVEDYHPMGDPEREKTDEFIHWIYDDKKQANALLRLLRKRATDRTYYIRATEAESWELPKKPAQDTEKKKGKKK